MEPIPTSRSVLYSSCNREASSSSSSHHPRWRDCLPRCARSRSFLRFHAPAPILTVEFWLGIVAGLLALAPSGKVSASATLKGKGVVCIMGGEKKDVAEGKIRRRAAFSLLLASPVLSVAFSAYGKSKNMNPYDERRLLQQNKKIQEANRAPEDFPNFIREGFEVKVVTSDNYITRDSGLMYEDIKVGTGNSPKDGQQIIFHYVGYNEAGRRIDSTYIQGSPAKIRLGNGTLVPGKSQLILDIGTSGFEEGIRDMKPGGKRRIIIPPELGPPLPSWHTVDDIFVESVQGWPIDILQREAVRGV
ncbi:hypothetical protein HU200_034196 [Digitaria exilis]|uniref:peptidylprolyl isomerase n=1 Tax=Digitaria exilis TaxID=1010633 RepID=A0A835EK98_9POAL|nr:hypothetical protein HU200_034196 [Digitaria exilis]